jgi:hypothetical protein
MHLPNGTQKNESLKQELALLVTGEDTSTPSYSTTKKSQGTALVEFLDGVIMQQLLPILLQDDTLKGTT